MTRPVVQQWAGFYSRSLGWKPVPLVHADKKALIPNWQAIDFRPEDFRHGDNIGLKSTDGVVLFDDDCAKRGFQMDAAFLPDTPAIYGRPSAVNSKRLYFCPELQETRTWTDLAKDHLVQLRVGQQDMVPPSIHPATNERLAWAGRLWNGMLSPTSAASLIHACNLRATAALIAMHWPARGRRELLLAYARVFLETLDLNDDIATKTLLLACRLGHFDADGMDKARRAVTTTREKLETRSPALGAAHIRAELPEGAALLRRLREWFGKTDAVAEAVERLNDTYFVIDVGTQTVVGEQVIQSDKEARHWTELRFRSFEDFKKKLVKEFVQTGTKTTKSGVEPIFKPLADVWLKNPQGKQYDRLVYAPEGSGIRVGPRDLNGWKGFTVQPAPGCWTLTRDTLLKNVMCGGHEALWEWTLDWVAALFQRPGQHAETALVLTGNQGAGKNVIADLVLGWTFDGRHYRLTTHTRQVLGEFNDILSGLCLLVLDEVGLSTVKEYSATKGLITGHSIDVNRKNINIVTERSMLHTLFLSNDDVPIGKVAGDDRRFAIYHLADTHVNDVAFFAAIARELDVDGGRAAMLHELLARAVDWDRLRLAPDTEPKQTAKRENWTPAQMFFFRMMRDVGQQGWITTTDRNGNPLRRIAKKEAANEYLQYLRDTNSRREVKDARIELHNELKKLVPNDWDFNRAVSEKDVLVRDYWTLPCWSAFQESFELAVGSSIGQLLAEDMSPQPQLEDWGVDPETYLVTRTLRGSE